MALGDASHSDTRGRLSGMKARFGIGILMEARYLDY